MTAAFVVEEGVPGIAAPSAVAGVMAAVPHVQVLFLKALAPPLAAAGDAAKSTGNGGNDV